MPYAGLFYLGSGLQWGVHSVSLADKHKKCLIGARKALLALHKHKKHAFRVCRSDYQPQNSF